MEQTPTHTVTKFPNNQQEEYDLRRCLRFRDVNGYTHGRDETGAQGSGDSNSNILHFPKLLPLQEVNKNWERGEDFSGVTWVKCY